jgi:GRAM domain
MTSTYSPAPARMTIGRIALAGVAFAVLFAPMLWGITMWLTPSSPMGYPMVAVVALLSGTLFAVLIGLFANSKMVAEQTSIELPVGESLMQQGLATHFRGIEGRGGRLYLTDRNLIFQPHKFNIQSGRVVIPRADIAKVSTAMTLGVIPNGIRVTRRDGTTERFVVSDRKEWVRKFG